MTPRIFVLNGPNLNRLGTREPHLYGAETLADLRSRCEARARSPGLALDWMAARLGGPRGG